MVSSSLQGQRSGDFCTYLLALIFVNALLCCKGRPGGCGIFFNFLSGEVGNHLTSWLQRIFSFIFPFMVYGLTLTVG